MGKGLRDWLAMHLPARFFTDPELFSLYRGWHITPAPENRELSDEVWSSPSSMSGVDLNQRLQLDLLARH